MKKCYIALNTVKGWKIVLDGKHVDCSNPVIQFGLGDNELSRAKEFCKDNNLEVIRICN